MYYRTAISLIMLSVTALSLGCDKIGPGNTASSPTGSAKLAVAETRFSPQPEIHEVMGTVRAQTSSIIASQLMGTVVNILVKEGQPVDAGELLIELDHRQVSAQLQQAEAALSEAHQGKAAADSALLSARAGAELARTNDTRYTAMLAEQAVTPQEADAISAGNRQAQAALEQAEAMAAAARSRVEQARAAVAAARVSSGDASVKAPYKGIITAKLVDVGDLAFPGMPLLKIDQTEIYTVELDIPETLIENIRIDAIVSVQVPAAKGALLDGKVETIVPAADTKSRSFLVKVRLPDTPHVKSGMFARVAIPLGTESMMLVPSTAVVHEGQLTGIFTLDDDHTARFRLLRTGRKIGDSMEVLSGLTEGTRYVVSPPPGFKDGTKVEGVSS
jgi:RND family efflux transporter MFP subunit